MCCPQPFLPVVLCPFPFRDIRCCAEGDVIYSSAWASGDAWGMDGSRTKVFTACLHPYLESAPRPQALVAKPAGFSCFCLQRLFCFGHMVSSGVKRKLTFSDWTECPFFFFYLRTGSCIGLSSLDKTSCSRHRNQNIL